jgi:hypothetical protein
MTTFAAKEQNLIIWAFIFKLTVLNVANEILKFIFGFPSNVA